MRHSLSFVVCMILLLAVFPVCGLAQPESAAQPQSAPSSNAMACVKGAVFYRSPVDAGLAPYAEVTVSAWRTGTEEGLGEVKTEADGRFRIELTVPEGGRIDLRVWGAQRIGGTGYYCRGAAEGLLVGGASPASEDGCIEVEIVAECQDRVPHRFH
ncbi:exported hypothetical protein [uncultured Desulfatiglans sp.]|nr:exported hypothetical protein [uncultured Desulfatiglans sp.]